MSQPIFSPQASAVVGEYRRKFGRPSEKSAVRSTAHLNDGTEHELVITGVKGSNGKRLRLRCICMAEYRGVKRTYFNYDHFAIVSSLDEARAAYDTHVEQASLAAAI